MRIRAAIARPHTPPVKIELLPEADAAQFLAMSRAFLRAARCGRGTGPSFVRIGRAIRYELGDLQRFIEERRVEAGGR